MISSLQCKIATTCNAGCYQIISTYYLDTINCILALLAIRQGVWKKTRCRKNLISHYYHYYGHQLKGEDKKYGMLLGVDAMLFYPSKDEANGIVWKRTK